MTEEFVISLEGATHRSREVICVRFPYKLAVISALRNIGMLSFYYDTLRDVVISIPSKKTGSTFDIIRRFWVISHPEPQKYTHMEVIKV